MFQFSGLACLPFALLPLSGDTTGPYWMGVAGAMFACAMTGIGMHATQTAGLALATDMAPEADRPRVVALPFVMLLIGMGVASAIFGLLLDEFGKVKPIQAVQGSAVATIALNLIALNLIALWRQKSLIPRTREEREAPRPAFRTAWASYASRGRITRLPVATGLGGAAFAMQDILLEPYGGEVLKMSVGATTSLTALWSIGALIGFAVAANRLGAAANPYRLASVAVPIGIAAFSAVIFSQPLGSAALFRAGALSIGLGSGLFGVCMLNAAMSFARGADSGIALGAWGAA